MDAFAVIGASASLLCAMMYFRRERRYLKMMNDVDNMQVIEFDNVLDISDLPSNNEMFALRGTIGESLVRSAMVNSKKNVIFSMIARVSKEPLPTLQGTVHPISFEISNPQGLKITVNKGQRSTAILFDLNKISHEFDAAELRKLQNSKAQSDIQPVFLKRAPQQFIEVAILPEQEYIFVGSLARNYNGSRTHVFTPKIIMGDNKVKFLKALDIFLAQNSQKGKQALLGAAAITLIHFTFKKILPSPQKRSSNNEGSRQ